MGQHYTVPITIVGPKELYELLLWRNGNLSCGWEEVANGVFKDDFKKEDFSPVHILIENSSTKEEWELYDVWLLEESTDTKFKIYYKLATRNS